MTPEPRAVADYACKTGEGPIWHAQERCVYWTDIPNGRLFRYDPATGEHRQVYSGRQVGGMTVQQDGKLLLFMDHGTIATWDGKELTPIVEEIPGERGNRFNDVIADPEGRVFAGTMSTPEIPGRLYRLDPDRTLTLVVEGTKTSNGMGFSPDLKTLYFTDSGPRRIYRFDYDRETGEVRNQEILVQVEGEGEGSPDGMTVDVEGYLWSTRWDGSCVVRYDPHGREVLRIPFPTRKVSCPTFGGPEYGDLYVTTAGGDRKDENGMLAGALFVLQPGVKGRPEFVSRIE